MAELNKWVLWLVSKLHRGGEEVDREMYENIQNLYQKLMIIVKVLKSLFKYNKGRAGSGAGWL